MKDKSNIFNINVDDHKDIKNNNIDKNLKTTTEFNLNDFVNDKARKIKKIDISIKSLPLNAWNKFKQLAKQKKLSHTQLFSYLVNKEN